MLYHPSQLKFYQKDLYAYQWWYWRYLDASRGFHAVFWQADIEPVTKPLIKRFMQMLWVVTTKNIAYTRIGECPDIGTNICFPIFMRTSVRDFRIQKICLNSLICLRVPQKMPLTRHNRFYGIQG